MISFLFFTHTFSFHRDNGEEHPDSANEMRFLKVVVANMGLGTG